jgi:predicted CXXCH cytochrome family protein
VKKLSFLLLAVAVLVAFSTGLALANFGPHGGYTQDTDACAGCHRAHTSNSDLTWTNNNITHNALLVTNATTMSGFCNACHGTAAPGASTNVVDGVFDAGPSAGTGVPLGGALRWATDSTYLGALNGGGFTNFNGRAVTSSHGMDLGAATLPAWGFGASTASDVTFSGKGLTCTDCHDPHGSSNYRLLKDQVNGVSVGHYDVVAGNQIPDPFVVSAERGYPLNYVSPTVGVVTGWLKNQLGVDQVANYYPDYTSPKYAYRNPAAGDQRSISGWCSACHTAYIGTNNGGTNYRDSVYNYNGNGVLAPNTASGGYHRHPMNISLGTNGDTNPANRALMEPVTTDTAIPLEMAPGGDPAAFRAQGWTFTDYLGCLTCHRAHGVDSTMTGYADSTFVGGIVTPNPSPTGAGGVAPTNDSALLRRPNRGVCERCHNK